MTLAHIVFSTLIKELPDKPIAFMQDHEFNSSRLFLVWHKETHNTILPKPRELIAECTKHRVGLCHFDFDPAYLNFWAQGTTWPIKDKYILAWMEITQNLDSLMVTEDKKS